MNDSSNRWWENYLVRYFLPSIAGMFIVKWLALNTGSDLKTYFPPFMQLDPKDFGTAHLLVWFLFGSFYCYLASYPILVFHATRSIDFKDLAGNPSNFILNPYLATLVFAIVAYCAAWLDLYWLGFLATVVYAAAQLFRLYKAFSAQRLFTYKKGYEASLAYAYLDKLSKRRSVKEEQEIRVNEEEGQGTTTHNRDRDLADSYKHLREHGNTAFIFFLELALCPVIFLALKGSSKYLDFAWLVPLLLIWVFPATAVHWFGQHLERRFSWFKG